MVSLFLTFYLCKCVLTLFLSGTSPLSPIPFKTWHRQQHFQEIHHFSLHLWSCSRVPSIPDEVAWLVSVLPGWESSCSDRWVASVQVLHQGTDEEAQKMLGSVVIFRQAVKTVAVSKARVLDTHFCVILTPWHKQFTWRVAVSSLPSSPHCRHEGIYEQLRLSSPLHESTSRVPLDFTRQ